jgi:hypothetical protein
MVSILLKAENISMDNVDVELFSDNDLEYDDPPDVEANLLSEEEENERIMLGFIGEEDGDDGNNDDANA